MIQRLLRGRMLYVVLGLLVLFLYVREFRQSKSLGPHPETAAPLTAHSLPTDRIEWWPSAADRAAVEALMRKDPRLTLTLWGLALFGFGMAVGGVGLFLWGLWTGRIRAVWSVAPRRLPAWSFGEVGRLTLLAVIVVGLLPFVHVAVAWWDIDPHLWMTSSMLGLDGFLVVAIAAFASGKASTTWTALGMRTSNVWETIRVSLRAYAAVFPWLFLLLFGMVELSQRLGWEIPLEPIHELVFQEQRPAVLGLTALLACVVGPVTEELFFRGVLYAAIRRNSSRAVAMLASGALFSLVHTNAVGFLPIMLLGCLLAYLYERTGSLLGSIAVHALHNTFLMSLALVLRPLLSP